MSERFSRRDALYSLGAVFLTGTGIFLGLDKLLAPLDLNQRKHTFHRLYDDIGMPEGKEKLRAWLLFQGAQAYAASRGDNLTAEAQQRYLFGDGTDWDITPQLTQHLLSRHGPYTGAIRDPDQALTLFYQHGIQNSFDNAQRIDKSFHTGMEPNIFQRAIKQRKPFTLETQGIADGGMFSRDVLSTLGRFTVYNQGEISTIQSTSTPMRHGWYLNQHGGTAHMYDIHDWNHTQPHKLGGRISAAEILESILVPLGATNPRESARKIFGSALEDATIEIRGEHAILLEEHGLAKPFPIYTQPHQMRTDHSWYIPDNFF